MCRSIKVLRNPESPATDAEIEAAALQFVRKISGYRQPSRANAEAFGRAVAQIAEVLEAAAVPTVRTQLPLRAWRPSPPGRPSGRLTSMV